MTAVASRIVLVVFAAAAATAPCSAEGSPSALRPKQWFSGRQHTDESRQAELSQPNTQPSHARPSIIIKGSEIHINGRRVALGGPLSGWVSAIAVQPSCSARICTWTQLGMQVGTDPGHSRVHFVDVYVRIPQRDPLEDLVTQSPTGEVLPKQSAELPALPFPGYLELDHSPIGSSTRFSDLKIKVARARALRCGLRQCEFPFGAFSDNATIYFRLNNTEQTGYVVKFNITALGLESY